MKTKTNFDNLGKQGGIMKYELFNLETEAVDAIEDISPGEAADRNQVLRSRKEPYRWIPAQCEFDEEEIA
jgi:hypothetical protein